MSTDSGGGARVAVVAKRGKFLVAEPFFGGGPRLALSRQKDVGVGDLVLVRPGAQGKRGRGRAQVARRLGRPDVARDVIEALMLDRGLRRGFDPAVAREARKVAVAPGEAGADGSELAGDRPRRDLRELATFTIDPVSARDFDDAISAEALEGGGWRVWVHIADVSAYVRPRSLIDREAYHRATSVYVPGTVEPMLPEALSADVCSLVLGQERYAVTAEMTVRGEQVSSAAFYRSLIRSDARLDYDQVDRIFTGVQAAQPPWGEPLAAARAASGALAERRASQGALVLDSPESVFEFDRGGHVHEAQSEVSSESHRLIEHLMIAANEQVAAFLESRRVPALYRVHERPDGTAVKRLVAQLASLGVPTPPVPEVLDSQQAAEAVAQASQLLAGWLARRGGRGRRGLTSLVLRSLKQAYYDHRNLGHAGLRSSRYCHFTSPIRRYPDLICHRALLSALDGGEPTPDGAWVAGAGPWCSTRERDAMTIERDADDVARCFLLERELAGGGGEPPVFEGEAVGLIGAGAFVAFGEGQRFEGMLPVRRLHGDWWVLNEEATMLVGTRSGEMIRLGDTVKVRVSSVDAPRGRVDLLPAWD